jgi:hypothetical protein
VKGKDIAGAGCGIGCLAVILFVVIGASQSGGRSGPDLTTPRIMAEDFVADSLKSPSTAAFSGRDETRVYQDGNTWYVHGWVDSQNSFGATVRTRYHVTMRQHGQQWKLVDINFN